MALVYFFAPLSWMGQTTNIPFHSILMNFLGPNQAKCTALSPRFKQILSPKRRSPPRMSDMETYSTRTFPVFMSTQEIPKFLSSQTNGKEAWAIGQEAPAGLPFGGFSFHQIRQQAMFWTKHVTIISRLVYVCVKSWFLFTTHLRIGSRGGNL